MVTVEESGEFPVTVSKVPSVMTPSSLEKSSRSSTIKWSPPPGFVSEIRFSGPNCDAGARQKPPWKNSDASICSQLKLEIQHEITNFRLGGIKFLDEDERVKREIREGVSLERERE